jgi:hypothetical protein
MPYVEDFADEDVRRVCDVLTPGLFLPLEITIGEFTNDTFITK